MQGFNMGRYNPPAALDRSLASSHVAGFNEGTNRAMKRTVRFEMPFDIWCTTCSPEAIIPQGVRFNAEKNTVGKYYSSPIFSFRMKHGACGGTVEIRTDPENREYAVHEGGRRKAIPVRDNSGFAGQILTAEERQKRQEDAFAHIEGRTSNQVAEKEAKDEIKLIRKERARFWREPYTTNSDLRRSFRLERKAIEASDEEKAEISDRLGIEIDLVDATKSDAEMAANANFGDPDQEEKDRFWAANRSIFSETKDRASNSPKSNGKDQRRPTAVDRKRELFHKVKRTERLQQDPWSSFYAPSKKTEPALPSLKPQTGRDADKALSKNTEKEEPALSRDLTGKSRPIPLVDYASDSDE